LLNNNILRSIIDSSAGSSVPVSFDLLPEDESLIDFYFIANDVDGLPSGGYYYDQETESLEQLKLGNSGAYQAISRWDSHSSARLCHVLSDNGPEPCCQVLRK